MKTQLLAATVLLAATAANAQGLPEGFYIQGSIGYSDLSSADFSGVITPPGGNQTVDTDFDDGYAIGIAIGREIAQWSSDNIGARVELEFSYRDNDVDGINFSGNGPAAENNISGDVTSTSLFANLLFDFKQAGRVTPFVGLGAGVTRTDLDFAYNAGVRVDGDDTGFAAQAIAGLAYAINDNTSLILDARYIRSFDVSSPRFLPNGTFTGDVEDDLDAVTVNVGFRYQF